MCKKIWDKSCPVLIQSCLQTASPKPFFFFFCHIQIVSRLFLESANLIGFPQMCLSRIRFSMFSQFKYTVFGVCAEDLKLFRGTKGAGLRIEKMCFRPFKQ